LGREAERSALFSAIQNGWPVDVGPVAWPNIPFNVPANSRWAQVTLLTYSTDRISLGQDVFLKRSVGSLQIDLFCPRDIGSAENKTASDLLEDFFEDRILVLSADEKIEFGTPESRETDSNRERQDGTNSNWFRTVVDCPFQRDQVKRK
jgi:hypothetical protein